MDRTKIIRDDINLRVSALPKKYIYEVGVYWYILDW